MCWVMPPASPATTLAERMRSSRSVLPWSTWPMTVMTGGRGALQRRGRRRRRRRTSGLELDLLLLAGLDEQDLGADLEREQLHLLVGERHGGRDHLAVLQQEAHDVGRGAVQLRPELLRRRAALDDDRALGHGRVGRRVASAIDCGCSSSMFRRRRRFAGRALAALAGAATAARDHRDRHQDRRGPPGPPPGGCSRDGPPGPPPGPPGAADRPAGRPAPGRRGIRAAAGATGTPPGPVRAGAGPRPPMPGGGGIGLPRLRAAAAPGGGGIGLPRRPTAGRARAAAATRRPRRRRRGGRRGPGPRGAARADRPGAAAGARGRRARTGPERPARGRGRRALARPRRRGLPRCGERRRRGGCVAARLERAAAYHGGARPRATSTGATAAGATAAGTTAAGAGLDRRGLGRGATGATGSTGRQRARGAMSGAGDRRRPRAPRRFDGRCLSAVVLAAAFAGLAGLGSSGCSVADQAVALGPAADAVGLGLLDARRVALHADAERDSRGRASPCW